MYNNRQENSFRNKIENKDFYNKWLAQLMVQLALHTPV